MYTVYHLRANDLNSRFLQSLKALFKDMTIEITVSQADETAYLLQSEANRRRLLQAVENVNRQQNLVEVPLDALP